MLSSPLPHNTAATLRDAMRQLASGVSIITAGTGAARAGLTATSVTSLTLEPPCVLACLNRKVSAWPTIRDQGRFCVNILADHHSALAARFSGSSGIKGAARFDSEAWYDGTHGTPVLGDALAAIECDVDDAIERHSHVILIGAVRTIRAAQAGKPLLYAQGRYGSFGTL